MTTLYGDKHDTHYKATTDGDPKESGNNLTLVTHRRKKAQDKVYIFVGNLPTNASIADVWMTVQGNRYFVELFLPVNRDKYNNRFDFVLLKEHFLVEEVLKTLHFTKRFGQTLGFSKARQGPSTKAVGHKPYKTDYNPQSQPPNDNNPYNTTYNCSTAGNILNSDFSPLTQQPSIVIMKESKRDLSDIDTILHLQTRHLRRQSNTA